MHRLVGLILLISVAHGQIQLSGSCSTDIDNKWDLDTFYNYKKLFGQWYEIERINNSFEKGDCSTLTMKFVFTFRTGLLTQLSHREVVNGQLSMRNGALVPIPPEYSAIYEDGVSYDFVVLKTNYNDYAILYSCQNTTNGKSVMAWKLSRTPTPSYTSLTNFDTVVKNNTDLVNATWFTPSHSKEACTIRNNAINLQNTANGKFENNPGLVNATWFTPSHSKEASTIRNNEVNLQNTANGKSVMTWKINRTLESIEYTNSQV